MKTSVALLLVFLLVACSVAETTEPRRRPRRPANPHPPASHRDLPSADPIAASSHLDNLAYPHAGPSAALVEPGGLYQLTVRSFYDSNGDGIGDFNGLIEKLDYLNDGDPATTDDLGITGIWLLPIHPSPRRTASTSPITTPSTRSTAAWTISAAWSMRRTAAASG